MFLVTLIVLVCCVVIWGVIVENKTTYAVDWDFPVSKPAVNKALCDFVVGKGDHRFDF